MGLFSDMMDEHGELVAENARLRGEIATLETCRRMDLRFVGVSEQVTRVALDKLWNMLGVENQTMAVLKVDELKSQRGLSDAYLRLRRMIPGALLTPHAPTPEQVWETTEKALAGLKSRVEAMEAELGAE